MIEAIQVIRDVVIILAGVIITAVLVIVGWAVLDLIQKVEILRVQAVDLVAGVARPIKGVLLAISKLTGH